MFSLISGFITWYTSKTEVKILVLGLDNAGKTTFLERVKSMFSQDGGASSVPLDRILPTIGLNMGRVQAHGCDLTLWDLGGQQSFRSIWNNYFEDADVLIYVVDSADSERFEEATRTLHKIVEHPEAASLPVLILGNKNDMPLAQDVSALRTLFDVENLCLNERTVQVMSGSAVTSKGIADALEWVVSTTKLLKEQRQHEESKSS